MEVPPILAANLRELSSSKKEEKAKGWRDGRREHELRYPRFLQLARTITASQTKIPANGIHLQRQRWIITGDRSYQRKIYLSLSDPLGSFFFPPFVIAARWCRFALPFPLPRRCSSFLPFPEFQRNLRRGRGTEPEGGYWSFTVGLAIAIVGQFVLVAQHTYTDPRTVNFPNTVNYGRPCDVPDVGRLF